MSIKGIEPKAGEAWRQYIKQFPSLANFWNGLPEPTNIWLSQQIDIFAGKYPINKMHMTNKLRNAKEIWYQALKESTWTDCAVAAINEARKEVLELAAEKCDNAYERQSILDIIPELQ